MNSGWHCVDFVKSGLCFAGGLQVVEFEVIAVRKTAKVEFNLVV